MAKPLELTLWSWNEAVVGFHGESDRGSAVLAGGFVENYLATFLKAYTVDESVVSEIFGAMGPLSSFSQRIAIARAFGFISRAQYEDLTLIRKIRNYFAHHPFGANFGDTHVHSLCAKLSQMSNSDEPFSKSQSEGNRSAYLLSCGVFCGQAYKRMERDGRIKQ